MYVIYQCYEHLATLTIPPAPYCPRATGLNLWVSGKSGPEKGAGMDKNMLAGLDGLPEQDKARMAAMIDHLQLRDSLRMYNSLVERCFNDCVDNFTRKTLQKQEETCVMRCAEKFLKHSMRVGMRFAELNSQAATQE
ncbi:mitochondrial import inner membrane translocase subunit TIM9 [Citrus sinensis]|nr:mitochondrial import inner membrane translocase subunit TIM9 [Citrus sinensis]